jgi:hypothetical protein
MLEIIVSLSVAYPPFPRKRGFSGTVQNHLVPGAATRQMRMESVIRPAEERTREAVQRGDPPARQYRLILPTSVMSQNEVTKLREEREAQTPPQCQTS